MVDGSGDGHQLIIDDFVETSEYRAAAAGHSVDAQGWLAEFDTGFAAIAGSVRPGGATPADAFVPARVVRCGLAFVLAVVGAAWCTADEFYGGDRQLRRDLQTRGVGYVLAVARSHRVTARPDQGPVRADRLAANLPSRAWNRLSAGAGSKGDRDYDWARITITPPDGEAAGQHTLLIRRRITDASWRLPLLVVAARRKECARRWCPSLSRVSEIARDRGHGTCFVAAMVFAVELLSSRNRWH